MRASLRIQAAALTAALLLFSTTAHALLEHGNSGASVRQLQTLLKDKNYYSGKIDGKFGDGTERAVRNFQRDKGLPVDGKAGDKTWSLLNPISSPEPTLRMGSSDSAAVKRLQDFLGIKQDGEFGQGTKNAVKKLQKAQGIRADGIAGPDTWAALKR